jgi:hypothetical protein
MSVKGGPNTVTNGLVLELDAANPKSYPGSGTIWYDKSGNSNNGVLTNGPTFTTRYLGGIVFDETDDSVNIARASRFFSGASQVTVCVWFRLTSSSRPNLINIPTGAGAYFSIENGSSPSTDLKTYFNNNNATSFPFTLNVPSYIVSTFNSGVVTTYKDGVLIDTKNNSSSTIGVISSSDLVIGRWGWVYSNAIAGDVYSVQVFNRALSSSEVLQNFNATKSRFGIV